jgi:peptide chain release factor 1
MFEKLKGVEERFSEIEKHLSDPEIVNDRQAYQKLILEHAELNKIVSVFKEYQSVLQGIEDSTELLQDSDPEIKNLARDEVSALNQNKDRLEDDLRKLLLPKDPNDDKNVIVEIRAGTGGEEAALFAGDLFRMYTRYAENRKWQVEVMAQHLTGVGGIKEAYSQFKYESGIHRVQRVPTTEAQGRIHTSAVTVAVLPEAEEVDVKIDPSDLKIDVYRSTGPGGQSVNTTDSAVRITHLPTGHWLSPVRMKSRN